MADVKVAVFIAAEAVTAMERTADIADLCNFFQFFDIKDGKRAIIFDNIDIVFIRELFN